MSDEHEPPTIKVTDRRHFDKSGEKRPGEDVSETPETPTLVSPPSAPAPAPPARGSSPATAHSDDPSREASPGRLAGDGPRAPEPVGSGAGPRISDPGRAGAGSRLSSEGPGRGALPPDLGGPSGHGEDQIAGDLSEVALGLSSSFSLLIARLAQETEIYLGLVPYPGKETAEPDLEAARAMIDVLSMLQEKTRGNLDDQEAHLLENLLYTYRLEYVRRRSGGDIR